MMQEDDKLINMIQSSTRGLLASFKAKAELLSQCSEDVKQFLREGYDVKKSQGIRLTKGRVASILDVTNAGIKMALKREGLRNQ